MQKAMTAISPFWAVLIVVAGCLMPLFLTPVFPIVDFYAHAVRYHVLADPDQFVGNYQPFWALLPNLGMDILGTALMRITEPLMATKLILALVVLAPVTGILILSWALHGRLQAVTVFLAGLTGYSLIFYWGFANFLFGFGLAFAAMGLCVILQDRPALQLATAIVAGVVIFFVHGLVFALWGLCLGMLELGMLVAAGSTGFVTLIQRAARLLVVAVAPVILFFQMQTATAEGGTAGAFRNLMRIAADGGSSAVWQRLMEELAKRTDSVLRVAESGLGTWPDQVFGIALWCAIGVAIWTGAIKIDRRLRYVVALAVALIFVLPPNLFGVGHLDERMPLLALSVLIAGASVDRTASSTLVSVLVLLFPVNIAMASLSAQQAGASYRTYLVAIETHTDSDLAYPLFTSAVPDRAEHCKPQLFLLNLTHHTAVETFANATQQPLRLSGALEKSTATARSNPFDLASLNGAFAAGFDTVVLCASSVEILDQIAYDPASTGQLADGSTWALYRCP